MSMPSQPYPSQVVVVSPRYCAPSPVDLAIVQKVTMTSRDKFVVTDPSDNILFKVRGSGFSLRYYCLLVDAAGLPILTMRPKMTSVHSRWTAYKGESSDEKDLLFSIKSTSRCKLTKLHVFLANNTEEDRCDFRVEANWQWTSCVIYAGDSNTVVAQMQRKNKFYQKDWFMVTVQPNVDAAFVTAIIAMLDEINGTNPK